jgi:hypothetical protein
MFSMLRVKINFVVAENIEREMERERGKSKKLLTPVWSQRIQDFLELKQWNIARNPLNLHHERKILARFDEEIIIYAGDVESERAKWKREKFFRREENCFSWKRGKFC